MRVQIITKDNGVGLSTDLTMLRAKLIAVSGLKMAVDFTDHNDRSRKTKSKAYDLNIFLELINPMFFPEAHRNVLVPNPEWFMPWWKPHLSGIDQVWAKTRDGERIFRGHHENVRYMGWSSPDMHEPLIARERKLIHVAGGSTAKGTVQVIEAMKRLPQYELTIVSHLKWGALPPNVKQVERISPEEKLRMMNQAAIHLCPSSYEGFGHYINEARSVGAVIVTTNASPMNELVFSYFGLGASVATVSNQHFAQHKQVDVGSLTSCIDMAMQTPLDILLRLGASARDEYLKGDKAFEAELIKVLNP